LSAAVDSVTDVAARWTTESVLALAPDASSRRAAAGRQGAGDAELPVVCGAACCAFAAFAARRRLIHIQINI